MSKKDNQKMHRIVVHIPEKFYRQALQVKMETGRNIAQQIRDALETK